MRYNAAPGASAYGKPILNVVDKPCKKKTCTSTVRRFILQGRRRLKLTRYPTLESKSTDYGVTMSQKSKGCRRHSNVDEVVTRPTSIIL